jgi:acetyl-CoA synthetase
MPLKKKKKTKVRKKTVRKKITKESSNELIIKTKPQWIKSSLATKSKYEDKYSKSIKNNDEFWRKEGKRITWIKPYKKIKDVKYSTKDVKIKWFHDGTLNASANCIDRHLKDKKDKTAIIWVGDDPKIVKKFRTKNFMKKYLKQRMV